MSAEAGIVKNPMARVMSLRDFRLLFAGAATSLLGDQFALIATPWLVLKLTGDPLALGLVLALGGIPRAVFMLVGGAITDRFSPRLMMLISDIVRLILTALMTFAVFTDNVQMWMLYVFSLGFGLVAGFAVPAENSIVPMIVDRDDLHAGNSLMMGVAQLVGFVGPTVAGILIGSYSKSTFGITLAYGVDAISFAVSAVCIWLLHIGVSTVSDIVDAKENLWDSIMAGMRYLWNNHTMRLMFFVLMAVNFLLTGPLLVGIPILASQKLTGGAASFGLLMSAYAGGNLIGFIAAGSLPRPGGTGIRVLVITLLFGFGLVIGSLGLIEWVWLDFALLLIVGIGNGYLGILLFTWLQTQTPKEMLGRIMSILLFSNLGLTPISQAISGIVIKWSLSVLFIASGTLVIALNLWTAFRPELKAFSESLSQNQSK